MPFGRRRPHGSLPRARSRRGRFASCEGGPTRHAWRRQLQPQQVKLQARRVQRHLRHRRLPQVLRPVLLLLLLLLVLEAAMHRAPASHVRAMVGTSVPLVTTAGSATTLTRARSTPTAATVPADASSTGVPTGRRLAFWPHGSSAGHIGMATGTCTLRTNSGCLSRVVS